MESSYHETVQLEDIKKQPRHRHLHRLLNIMLLMITLLSSTVCSIFTPIVSSTAVKSGADPYVAYFIVILLEFLAFCPIALIRAKLSKCSIFLDAKSQSNAAIVGASLMLDLVLIAPSSLPRRTPPYLQAVLNNGLIPATILLRFLVSRKGISRRRLACTAIVMVGLFICCEPHIWQLRGSGETVGSATQRFIWPLCYGLATIPHSVVSIFFEGELHRSKADVFVFVGWCSLYQFLSVFFIFWIDIIPEFGMAENITELISNLTRQIECIFSTEASCSDVLYAMWVFVLVDVLMNLTNAAIVKFSDGALYYVVASSLVTPLVALFWNLFRELPHLHWSPHFTITTGFTLYGLVFLVPAVFAYGYFSAQEENDE